SPDEDEALEGDSKVNPTTAIGTKQTNQDSFQSEKILSDISKSTDSVSKLKRSLEKAATADFQEVNKQVETESDQEKPAKRPRTASRQTSNQSDGLPLLTENEVNGFEIEVSAKDAKFEENDLVQTETDQPRVHNNNTLIVLTDGEFESNNSYAFMAD